jgi:cytochrome c553
VPKQNPGKIILNFVMQQSIRRIENMKRVLTLWVACALISAHGLSQAADVDAGKAKSATCTGCHGPAGISSNPLWPNLAGQQEGYLKKQLKAFKDGTRQDPMMSPMAKPLSDADIENISVYYSGLKEK